MDSTSAKLEAMDRQQQIDHICEKIIRAFNPDRLVLFGSEARGTARPDSDIDLLVIMPFDGSPLKQATKLYGAIDDRRIPVDLIVRTPDDISWRTAEGDCFICEILREGKVIHEAHHA